MLSTPRAPSLGRPLTLDGRHYRWTATGLAGWRVAASDGSRGPVKNDGVQGRSNWLATVDAQPL
ncbi:MAG: hypothetical protein H8E66_12560 [Planctomycetes bacterium]|nr:hypothetical protein [Planctomycetota bacterium]